MQSHACVPEAAHPSPARTRCCSPVWLQGERDWLHANSVDYTLGPDGSGYVLISYNVPSEVVVVRWPAAGEAAGAAGTAGEGENGILFRFGNPLVARTGDRHARQLFCQHSARWVQGLHGAAGSSLRFILFNNGCAPRRRALNTKGMAAFATEGAAAFAHLCSSTTATRRATNSVHSRLQLPHALPGCHAPRQQAPMLPSSQAPHVVDGRRVRAGPCERRGRASVELWPTSRPAGCKWCPASMATAPHPPAWLL